MTEINHKDFLGQPLAVGDKVIIPNVNKYDGFKWGTIEKLTPHKVKVVYAKGHYGTILKEPSSVLLMGDEQLKALTVRILKS